MKDKIKKILRKGLKVMLGIIIFWHLLIILYAFLPVPVTPLMLQRCAEQLFAGKPVTLKKDWVSMEKISENMALAAVCAEDQKFMDHEGFDFEAIEKALESNNKRKKKGKPIKGGSTISQQTAKNVFLFPQRSWIRKGLEVYFTFWIELLWSKERILEVYLNVIEMGDGIYGAQAAAQQYYHKNASELTGSEAATIAACFPNPLKYSVQKPGAYIVKRRNWIMRQMARWGELDFEQK